MTTEVSDKSAPDESDKPDESDESGESAESVEHGEYVQPDVGVDELRKLLDGDHAAVRDLVRASLAEHAGVLEDAETMSRADFRDRVKELVVDLASTGQTGLGFPEEYGGGDDVAGSIAAFETMGYGDLSVLVKMGVQFGLFGGAILHLGTKVHHDKYLPDLITGDLLGCFAMTETGHGSNVQALGTFATYDTDTHEFVIDTREPLANKDYIGNAAAHGQVAVVFAQLEVAGESHGVHAFVVPIRENGEVCTGVRIEDDGLKMGLNGVDNGRIWFDDVRVPRSALLNQFADVTEEGVYESSIENPNRRFFTMLGTLVQGRVSVGGAGISAAKVALTIAIKYALHRRQFEATSEDVEDLLLDYGLHQRRLFPLLARTYALHFAQDVLRAQLHDIFTEAVETADAEVSDEDEARRRRQLESRAAGTKVLGTWHATKTIQECREACGGAGYLAINRFAALKADTDVFTTFEGDNHVLLQLVAKGLLTDYASSFEELDKIGMVRFVAELAVDTVLERTRAHKMLEQIRELLPGGNDDSWDQDAGLLDPTYQMAMLEFREEHMLGGVARRLKRGIDNDMNPGEVFSRVQDHVIAAARAHVERLVLQAFVEKTAELPDGDLKVALNLLCDLHALCAIEADRAWFMEHGRLTSARSKAISREINDLCRKIRPLAGQFVDAFGIPPEMLRAPDLVGATE